MDSSTILVSALIFAAATAAAADSEMQCSVVDSMRKIANETKALSQQLADTQLEIAGVKSGHGVLGIGTKLQELETMVNKTEYKSNSVQDEVTTLTQQLDDTIENVTKLQGEDGVKGLKTSLEQLDTTVKTRKITVDESMASMNGKLDSQSSNTTKLDSEIKRIETVVETLERSISAQAEKGKPLIVSVYTRWGSTSCPSGTTILYDGQVAGPHHAHPGGAAQYLCMPLSNNHFISHLNPVLKNPIYGCEYEVNETNAKDGYHSKQNKESACAVCETPKSAVLMMAHMTKCPTEWNLEYRGVLMAGHYLNPSSTEYICVDDDLASTTAKSEARSKENENECLLFFVFTKCGSLHCPPFEDNKALNCVVCSK